MAVKLLQCFNQFDIDRDGFISANEMQSVLRKIAPGTFNDAQALAIVKAADVDGDGRLNPEEFVTWLYKESCTDFRSAVCMETWECFPSLKAGFDTYADKFGYVSLENLEALGNLAKYLGLDTLVMTQEMEKADSDSNGFVGFAEFALWADKNTVGISLGLEQLPDKRQWWLGMPKYWTSVERPVQPEAEKAAGVGSSFKPVPEDPDTSELEDFMKAGKHFNWKKVSDILSRHPGYIDMRPPYRFYATIHHAAYQGNVDILHMLVSEYSANPALINKGGESPSELATKRGKHMAAEYLQNAVARTHGSGDETPVPTRRGSARGDKEVMAACNEILDKAKYMKWDDMFDLLDDWPECVDRRPPYRRYAAIHQVVCSGSLKALQKLIEEYDADSSVRTKGGKTALELAESGGHSEIVAYLSKLSGSAKDLTKLAHELIDKARDGKWEAMFDLIKENPEIVNIRPDVRTYAALHQAAHHGDVNILKRLVEDCIADVTLKSKTGQTALQVAQECEKEDAVAYLQAASPMIRLEDDFVTFAPQQFVKVTDDKTLQKLRSLCEITHKPERNWTRDRMKASGFEDKTTPVPTGYEFVGAHRNEHPALWRIYQTKREVTRINCQDSSKGEATRWLPWTMEHPDLNWRDYDVSDESNEWMLFHASVPAAVKAICRSGFTMKTLGLGATGDSKSKLGLYGNGTYFTDCITKADEYARARVEDGDEFEGCRTLLVVRVVGGRHWYTDEEVKEEDKPEFAKRVLQGHYDSTVGDRLKLKNTFREIVAYDASGTFPEYIIYFKRKGVPPEHT